MKIKFRLKSAAMLLCMALLLSFTGCGGEQAMAPPDFSVIGMAAADGTEGKISYSTFEYENPEALKGMVITEEGGIISTEFSGITKTSDKFPQILDFGGSKILLLLRELENTPMNLTSVTEGKAMYSASTSQGDFTVIAESSGRVTYIKNETTGFTVKFTY